MNYNGLLPIAAIHPGQEKEEFLVLQKVPLYEEQR